MKFLNAGFVMIAFFSLLMIIEVKTTEASFGGGPAYSSESADESKDEDISKEEDKSREDKQVGMDVNYSFKKPDPFRNLSMQDKLLAQDVTGALRNGVKRPDLAKKMEGSHSAGRIFKELSNALSKGRRRPDLADKFERALQTKP